MRVGFDRVEDMSRETPEEQARCGFYLARVKRVDLVIAEISCNRVRGSAESWQAIRLQGCRF